MFLDHKKAFDTVDHNILLKKMSSFGIKNSEASWFRNYLDNRDQCVRVNNVDYLNVTCRVPEAYSTPGVWILIIYVNDFPKLFKEL